jgi:alpha-1,3-fucosyltransferase
LQINFIRALSVFVQCLIILYIKCQKHRVVIIFLFICTGCFLYSTYDKPKNIESSLTHIFDTNTSIYIPYSKVKYQPHKLILLWTDLFDNLYWHQDSFFNSSTIISCSSTHQCQFTRDRQKLSQASLTAFHLYDTNRYELPERESSKSNNQSWIFITGESPVNFYYQNPSFYPYILDNYFDRSISYKYDSPFSLFSPILKSRFYTDEIQHERQLNLNSLKSKKKAIAWIVSNCITFSQREKYVEELRKFIPIDIYGKCGKPCSKKNDHQCEIDLNEYYFYLSFENSRCNSYITEKFWNIISNNTHRLVPIVMGAEENDYKRLAPTQSYIHVNRYKTPADLAEYLNYLINNPEKYLMYLQWREHTEIEIVNPRRWISLLCPLCQMAYETRLPSFPRMNFSSWYNPKIECHHDDVKIFMQCKQANLRDWMSWIHNSKCP